MVRLDVRVLDGEGRPVGDIREDEVEVIEEGERRPVLFFQRLSGPTAPYLEAAKRAVAGEVSSNDGAPRGQLYVIVFDTHHITPGRELRSRVALERFLRATVKAGDRVSLYALPGPGPQVSFTSDVRKLLDELPKIVGGLNRVEMTSMGEFDAYEARRIVDGDPKVLQEVAARLRSSLAGADVQRATAGERVTATDASPELFNQLVAENARVVVEHQDQESRNFLAMFSDVLKGLGRIEGRKTVILFSEGFFVRNVTGELERAAAAAAQSSSSIYSFDLNDRLIGTEGAGTPRSAEEVQDRLQALAALSLETDGELFNDANQQLGRALGVVSSQSQEHYVVGFEPSQKALDNRDAYRRVSVNVRRPGVRVSARTGYALNAVPTPADRRRAIDAALNGPFAQRGLPVEYTTYVLRGATPGAHRVYVSLRATLPVSRDASARPADVIFVVRSLRDGRVAASGTDTVPLPSASEPDTSSGSGWWRVHFDLPPGEYLMRVVVREPGGLTGSADRRVEVRPMDGPAVSTSDLVLGASSMRALPVRARAHVGDVLTGSMELYGRTVQQLSEAGVEMELARVGEEHTARRAAGSLEEAVTTNAGATRRARVEMPLEGLAPGVYVAKATVNAGNEVVAELLREVEVHGGTPPDPVDPPGRATAAAENLDPLTVLNGEIARRYVARLSTAVPPSHKSTLEAAQSGAWDRVTLGTPPPDAPASIRTLAGLAAFARRDFTQANGLLEGVFLDDPTDAGLAFLAGWSAAAAGNDRQAVSAWRNSVRIDPSLVPAYLAMADAYERLAQPGLALQVLKSGLGVLPDSPELRARMASLEGR